MQQKCAIMESSGGRSDHPPPFHFHRHRHRYNIILIYLYLTILKIYDIICGRSLMLMYTILCTRVSGRPHIFFFSLGQSRIIDTVEFSIYNERDKIYENPEI